MRSICYVGFFWTLSWLILPGKRKRKNISWHLNLLLIVRGCMFYAYKSKVFPNNFVVIFYINWECYTQNYYGSRKQILSSCLLGLAWIIIPLPISLHFNGMLYNSWRLFLAVIGIPTLIVTLIAIRYPESPKFLASQGKMEEALAILRKIYAINTGNPEDEYPVIINEISFLFSLAN